ncbi:MAG TPA: CarD family transcriptional regulator, partial [Pyrinomonadaceae bacterium]|nr:CarD family transcriptional regulator [Pyrinomonadaceae bacterium]
MDFGTGLTKKIDELRSAVAGGSRVVSVSGLSSVASKALVINRLRRNIDRLIVVLTDTNSDADMWCCDLEFFRRQSDIKDAIIALPSFETDPYSGVSPHAETQERRALALWHLVRSEPRIVVMPARSLVTRTVAPAEIDLLGAHLIRDEDFPPDELISRLVRSGYVREDPLTGMGQFSVRGGIVDIWSAGAENPVRVEFFGDTVDSIREFDPETQLSTRHFGDAFFTPMREFAASPDDFREWAKAARKRFTEERFSRNLRDRTDFADEGEPFSGWEFSLAISRTLDGSVFEYLPKDPIFVIDEPAAVENSLSHLYEHTRTRFAEITETGDVGPDPNELFLDEMQMRKTLDGRTRIELRTLGRTAAATDEDFSLGEKNLFLFPTAEKAVELEIQSRSTRKFAGLVRDFAENLNSQGAKGIEEIIVVRTEGMSERLREILREYNASVSDVLVGDLSGGFEIPSARLAVYAESDIFGETTQAEAPSTVNRTQRRKSNLGAFISDFRDLKPGDYVVHVDHGIGRFDGLQTLTTGGMSREFMLLVYADDAKLFVPVERMDLVSRYSSGEATSLSLDRLGGLGWQKTKAKAKRAMRDMADELLRLYAERKLVRGHAFPPDAPWQREFEDAFPYDLTADQATAITDVKEDMETPSPMDRLIIGDVGYGKTEVAMRAAFKAVMDGRQVAILAPTTV